MFLLSDLDLNPEMEFMKWYDEAVKSGMKNPDAMALATATRSGIPSSRIVLYKGWNQKGLKFYTNYQSKKGKELIANPRASVVFYWSSIDKQIRIEGKVKKLSRLESDQYWNSRPRESQIHALVSPQSQKIPNRDCLDEKVLKAAARFQGQSIPRPSYWGGFVLIPDRFEFWILGGFRFHDRFEYLRQGKRWKQEQLAP